MMGGIHTDAEGGERALVEDQVWVGGPAFGEEFGGPDEGGFHWVRALGICR